jgi:hypothetical protein
MTTPSHIAYIVTQPRKGATERPFWRPIGAVWAHTKGDGFDLVIHDQIAVSGRIVCRPAKDRPAEPADESGE